MASSDRKFDQQLVEAGKNLLPPPTSVDELLQKLGHVESLLVEVDQSPPQLMLDAIIPTMKALVADELIKHSDVDVKVAVASCISEITRITAPEAPYDDEKMKDVFQLIVSSFEDLSDQSSRSYTKRTSILETVAKVRSCVIMLDLECEWLIADMFRHLLKAIRDYHPENVFSAMATIISLVVEESEDISLELLTPILAIFKKDKQDVLPVACKLVERVFASCKAKIKPCLVQAVESEAISLDEYSDVVADICGITRVNNNCDHASGKPQAEEKALVEPSSNDVPQACSLAEEKILIESSTDDMPQVEKKTEAPSDYPNQVSEEIVDDVPNNEPVLGEAPQPVKVNGPVEDGSDGPSAVTQSSNKPEIDDHTKELVDANIKTVAESLNPDITKEVETESQPEQSSKKIINMEDDGQHAGKKSDIIEAINAESGDSDRSKMAEGQHSDNLDTKEASKDGSSDLGSTKVVKLKLTEDTARRNSKKPEDTEETVKVTDEAKEAVTGDLEGSSVIEPKSKAEQIDRRRSKKLEDSKHSDQLSDVKEAGKADTVDLSNIKVVKFKFKSDKMARGSSKKPEDGQCADQSTDVNEASKADSGDKERSKAVQDSKSEQSSKRSSKKLEGGQDVDQVIETKEATKAESGELNSTKVVKPESKSVPSVRKRGRKFNSLSTREPSGSTTVDCEKEADKSSDHINDHNDDVPTALPSEKSKLSRNAKNIKQLGTLKATGDDSVKVVSPSHSGSLPDENQPKISAKVNKRLNQGDDSSADVPKDVAEGPSDSEVIHKKQSGKKAPVEDTNVGKKMTVAGGSGSRGKAKKVALVDKKNVSGNIDISLLRKKGSTKSVLGKGNSGKDTSRSSTKDDKKELEISQKPSEKLHEDETKDDTVEIPKTKSQRKRSSGIVKESQHTPKPSSTMHEDVDYSEETPKIGSKRKHSGKEKEPQHTPKPSSTMPEDMDYSKETPKISSKRKHSGKKKASSAIEYNESLVGLKVNVWWPDDAQFYKGVVHGFDSIKKKHKVLYDDGDEETLNLRKERWELIDGYSKTPAEEEDEHKKSDESSEPRQKKKAKTTAEKSTKKRKADVLGGRKSLSSSKVAAAKPGKISSEDDDDTDEDKPLVSKSLKPVDGKKESSQKTGKKVVGSTSKSKNESGSSKPSMKSKLDHSGTGAGDDTPKTQKKIKGKTPDGSNNKLAAREEMTSTAEEEESAETVKTTISRKKGGYKSTGKDSKKEEAAAEEESPPVKEKIKKGKSSTGGGASGTNNSNSRKRQKKN